VWFVKVSEDGAAWW